jgi:hypothetical protein
MSLARRFNAGSDYDVLVAWRRLSPAPSVVATRREHLIDVYPALKDRAKLNTTLRVETAIHNKLKFEL